MNTGREEKDKITAHKKNGKSISRKIAITALLSALLVVGKYALSWIIHIEVVTIFIIVFTCVFGWRMTGTAVNVFCALDPLIYPQTMSYPSIVAGYFVYWNLLCCLTYVFYKGGLRSPVFYAFYAFFMSFLFGIITAACETFMTGAPFLPLYAAGLIFYVIHMVSNFTILLFLFKPLSASLTKMYASYMK